MGKSVIPRPGLLKISGDGFSGGTYHIPWWGPKKRRKAARSSIACKVLAMAHASEAAGGLPSTLGAIWGEKIGTAVINDCFRLISQLGAGKGFAGSINAASTFVRRVFFWAGPSQLAVVSRRQQSGRWARWIQEEPRFPTAFAAPRKISLGK